VPEPPLGSLTGRLLAGRYRLDHLIATGGMAQVWEATDEVLTRRVAVKLLHPHLAADSSFVERFRREAIAAARLAHPSIVSIYDTCTDGEVEAIVMELVKGTTLRKLLDDKKQLEPENAVGIVAEVADALEAAHRTGLVHRDVKPANILLSDDGRVLVADFGIAKAAEGADLTHTGTALGTAKYLAPEQVLGQPVDARADVYALGVVLYECLCGRPPFVADTEAGTALARLQQAPRRPRELRAGIPKPLEDVVLRALAREPGDRYATAGVLRTALLAVSRGEIPVPDVATHTSVPGDSTVAVAPARDRTPAGGVPLRAAPPPRRPARSRVVPIFLALLIAAALIVGGILVSGADRSPSGTDSTNTIPANAGAGVRIAAATPFDPEGDGHEKDNEASNAIDGDPNTAWSTEGYFQRTFGTKSGVGLVLTLETSATLASLKVTSKANDWAFGIYVADSPKASLAEWGEPVATKEHTKGPGTTTSDLKGKKGSAVLIWITDVGDEATGHCYINEAQITAK
jgi:eukaryotic-like serine/threonine-protein kinase